MTDFLNERFSHELNLDTCYLDYCATTPIDPAVIAAMAEVYAQVPANPASQHRAGRQAKRVLEDAADQILQLVGCRH